MEIETKYFGRVKIEESDIINFASGIPGFLDEKQFVLLPLAEGTPFLIMQSVTTTEIAFVITNPFEHFPTYEFKLTDEVQETLKIESNKDVTTFVILTVADPFKNTTANLRAPIIINERTKEAKQIILSDKNYETKHLLVSKLPSKDKGETSCSS